MAGFRFLLILSLILLLSGCGGSDYGYENANDTKPGPGLFSGEDGVFTLIKKERQAPKETEEDGEEGAEQDDKVTAE